MPCDFTCLNCIGPENNSCISGDNVTRNLTNVMLNIKYSLNVNVGVCSCLFYIDGYNGTQCYGIWFFIILYFYKYLYYLGKNECPESYILDQNETCLLDT